jgi:hypothetical protein
MCSTIVPSLHGACAGGGNIVQELKLQNQSLQQEVRTVTVAAVHLRVKCLFACVFAGVCVSGLVHCCPRVVAPPRGL